MEQSEQRTHAGTRTTPDQSVSRALLALSDKAKREPKYRFRGLGRLISLPMLHECYHSLRKQAASGVDEVSWSDYGEGLAEKLVKLHGRLRTGRNRARLVRRKYIPKADGKRRPLGIPTVHANCTSDQRVFGLGGDRPSVSPAAGSAVPDSEVENLCGPTDADLGGWGMRHFFRSAGMDRSRSAERR